MLAAREPLGARILRAMPLLARMRERTVRRSRMIVLRAGLPDIGGAAAAAALILAGMVVSWFASPRPFGRALTRTRLPAWLGAVAEWGGVLRGSSVLWAVACGA